MAQKRHQLFKKPTTSEALSRQVHSNSQQPPPRHSLAGWKKLGKKYLYTCTQIHICTHIYIHTHSHVISSIWLKNVKLFHLNDPNHPIVSTHIQGGKNTIWKWTKSVYNKLNSFYYYLTNIKDTKQVWFFLVQCWIEKESNNLSTKCIQQILNTVSFSHFA